MVVRSGPYARMEAELVAKQSGGWQVRIQGPFGRTWEATLSDANLGLAAAPIPELAIREIEPAIDYARLFVEPDAVCEPAGSVSVRSSRAVCIVSGRVIGLDPTWAAGCPRDYAPYSREVPPGLYGTRVCIDARSRRVCAAMLQIATRPIARWRVAGVAAVDHERIGRSFNRPPDEPYEFECRGTAALCDADVLKWIAAHADAYREILSRDFFGKDRTEPDTSMHVGDDEELDLLALSAHDGRPCRAWWAEDDAAEPVALVLDLFSSAHGTRPR